MTDLKQTIIEALEAAQSQVIAVCEHNEKLNKGARSVMDRKDLENIESALTLLQGPAVYVGKWEINMDEAKSGQKVLVKIEGCDHAVLSRWSGKDFRTFGEDADWEGSIVIAWTHIPKAGV